MSSNAAETANPHEANNQPEIENAADAPMSEALPQSEEEAWKAQYEQEIASLKDQLLRALAETENLRRRSRKELEESARYAVAPLARDLSEVVENLIRAEKSIPAAERETNPVVKNLADGVAMTLKALHDVLNRHHITRIDPAGLRFDHNLHQAVAQVESAEHPEGAVVEVLQAGYQLHDRLLQPAIVSVAKSPANPQESSNS